MPAELFVITRDDIADFVSGRLSRDERRAVQALIQNDPRARDAVREIELSVARVRHSFELSRKKS
jgi:anti-sigma factor RsiW